MGMTQEEFALRAGLGLRFVRELEQGKETVRMDKVNKALWMFGTEAVPGDMDRSKKLEAFPKRPVWGAAGCVQGRHWKRISPKGGRAMRYLYCGKEINDPSLEERAAQWHSKCTRKFFGTTCHPVLELNDLILTEVAQKTVMEGYTVPGVQKRLSLHLFEEKEGMKLTIVDYPAGYILKPQTQEFSHLPELEQLGMCLA